MKKKLLLSACTYLVPEISTVIKNGDYPEVQLVSYPANCSLKALNQIAIPKIASKLATYSDIIVVGSYCYSMDNSEMINIKNLKVFQLQQCFDLIINLDTFYHFINQGNYIVTNGWLKNLNKHIKKWGFTPDSAHTFFQESLKSILLLDTKIPGDYMPNLLKLSDYMGLPFSVLPVGLSHCKKHIDEIVFNWRLENEKREIGNKLSAISKQTADHQLIFNQLETLVLLTNESEIIQIAIQLINMLYAPSKISYKFQKDGTNESIEFMGFFMNNEINSGNSFNIEIINSGELLGIFEIQGIQFPQFKKKYEEMVIVISQIFGMAIANARKYSELEKSKAIISESEKELRIISDKLRELNITKDKFFSIIAHDLKGPIGNLSMIIKLLNDEYEDFTETERIKFLHKLNESSDLIFKLLENLHVWSRSQSGSMTFEPRMFNLNVLINSVVKLLRLSADNKGISINYFAEKDVELFADPNLIKTVVRNLLSNAIKFTMPGGRIEINAEIIHSSDNDSEVLVSFIDSGLGMDAQKLEQLFKIEHNVSTPGTNKESGTGLGLILFKEFVEKHDGKIWVESQLGVGSSFFFTLPLKFE